MKSDAMNIDSLKDIIDNIIDKSCLIKAKNTNEIEMINDDFTKFLELGRKLIQVCLNDKVCKY